MKNIIFFITFFAATVFAANLVHAEECSKKVSESSSEDKEVSKVEMPKQLKGAMIKVTTADGKEFSFKAEEYMVAKRIKTTKVVRKESYTVRTCSAAEKKNEVLLGARRDYTGMDKKTNGTSASVQSERGPVLDATYIRRSVFDSGLNLGISLDTNGTPRGLIGVDF